MTNSRNKGAAFERDIAKRLFDELGIRFERDLDQYRTRDRGDLIPPDCPGWPYVIECKKTKDFQQGCKAEWWQQASTAAKAAGKIPVVIWATDRRPVRVTMELCDTGLDVPEGHHATISLDTFCMLAREAMIL